MCPRSCCGYELADLVPCDRQIRQDQEMTWMWPDRLVVGINPPYTHTTNTNDGPSAPGTPAEIARRVPRQFYLQWQAILNTK